MKPKVLLYAAWCMFLVSLLGPATQEPFFFFPAIHMPVGIMTLLSAFAAVASEGRSGNAVVVFVAVACFLASPVVANAPRRTFRRGTMLPVLMGVLLAWVPVAVSTGRASDELISLGSPMWGYYLFASALTLSSVGWAIIVFSSENAPPASEGLPIGDNPPLPWSSGVEDNPGRSGFPVVVRDEETTSPPQNLDDACE